MNCSDLELDEWVAENMNPDKGIGKAFINMMNRDNNKDVEIDRIRMIEYLKSIDAMKRFLNNNNIEYILNEHMFDVTKTDCRYDVFCDSLKFNNVDELLRIIDRASWSCFGVTYDDKVRISVEFWKVAKERSK